MTEKQGSGFTKAQLMRSKQYTGIQKDIMSVVLEDGQRYTHEQARKKIDEFGKRKVK